MRTIRVFLYFTACAFVLITFIAGFAMGLTYAFEYAKSIGGESAEFLLWAVVSSMVVGAFASMMLYEEPRND